MNMLDYIILPPILTIKPLLSIYKRHYIFWYLIPSLVVYFYDPKYLMYCFLPMEISFFLSNYVSRILSFQNFQIRDCLYFAGFIIELYFCARLELSLWHRFLCILVHSYLTFLIVSMLYHDARRNENKMHQFYYRTTARLFLTNIYAWWLGAPPT